MVLNIGYRSFGCSTFCVFKKPARHFQTISSDFIKIVEVGPRDGLQNEKVVVPTAQKIDLINKLSDTGLSYIESTSFVSPTAIPQLSDGEEVMAKIDRRSGITYSVLVPTLKHFEKAVKSNVSEVAFFTAASETFNQKNIRCSIETSLKRISDMMVLAKSHNIKVRGYVSCIVGCPYEGRINPEDVLKVAAKLVDLGCYEISLGDTIGVASPGDITKLLRIIKSVIPSEKLALHCHDTYGQALANILQSLEAGIKTFDTSIAGLGGCPYAPGASGNVATEDVLYMLNGLGLRTGIDFDKLLAVSKWLSTEILRRPPQSKVAFATYGSKC